MATKRKGSGSARRRPRGGSRRPVAAITPTSTAPAPTPAPTAAPTRAPTRAVVAKPARARRKSVAAAGADQAPTHKRRRPTPAERTAAVEAAVHTGVIVGEPVHPRALSQAEKVLLGEALRRAEEARSTIETAVVSFGRWLLVNVFGDSPRAALTERYRFPLWAELASRAGGPTLRMNRKMLYNALNIAAYDKHIGDESWRLLDTGRKALLLPLSDATAMRSAAQHVIAMKLSQRATQSYVRAQLEGRAKARAGRLGPRRARSLLARAAAPLVDATLRGRLRTTLAALPSVERNAARRQLQALAAALQDLLNGMKP